MKGNLEKFKADLKALASRGENLLMALQCETLPAEVEKLYGKEKFSKMKETLPEFRSEYQSWYSEAHAVVKQILPDRLADFVRHYEKPRNRKDITFENYVIEDCLQGLLVTKGWEKNKVVGADAAVPRFHQQLNILKSAEKRFESALFDIKHLVQADLFDSDLAAASELKRNGFFRAAGAMAGVVLEKHLGQVCENHNVKITKKSPSISDLNDLLKSNGVSEVAQWRFIQHLGDIRNLCDHNKKQDPKKEDIEDLILGVEKITKTIF